VEYVASIYRVEEYAEQEIRVKAGGKQSSTCHVPVISKAFSNSFLLKAIRK
jgi:hypothetical protein